MFIAKYWRQIDRNEPEEVEFTKESSPFFVDGMGIRQAYALQLINKWNKGAAHAVRKLTNAPHFQYWLG